MRRHPAIARLLERNRRRAQAAADEYHQIQTGASTVSTREEREEDARNEPVIEAIRSEYDAAATEIARYICRKRHAPIYDETPVDPSAPAVAIPAGALPITVIVGWTPHRPGTCDMAQEIENALWLAKDPPGPGMWNALRVYVDQMQAFTIRVGERTGVEIGGRL